MPKGQEKNQFYDNMQLISEKKWEFNVHKFILESFFFSWKFSEFSTTEMLVYDLRSIVQTDLTLCKH